MINYRQQKRVYEHPPNKMMSSTHRQLDRRSGQSGNTKIKTPQTATGRMTVEIRKFNEMWPRTGTVTVPINLSASKRTTHIVKKVMRTAMLTDFSHSLPPSNNFPEPVTELFRPTVTTDPSSPKAEWNLTRWGLDPIYSICNTGETVERRMSMCFFKLSYDRN